MAQGETSEATPTKVYVVGCDGAVKVGISQDPERRFQQLKGEIAHQTKGAPVRFEVPFESPEVEARAIERRAMIRLEPYDRQAWCPELVQGSV